MHDKTALIFGFNKYAFEIAEHVKSSYKNVILYSQNKEDINELKQIFYEEFKR